jgi:plastocyanin
MAPFHGGSGRRKEYLPMKRWLPSGIGRVLGVAFSLLLALALFVPPVAASSSHATYTVLVGYNQPKRGVNVDAYFPDHLQVHVGDTVKFKQNAPEIHTVTFLAGQTPPDLIGPNFPILDPMVYYPVVPAGHAYDGTSYANSGIMSTDPSYFLSGEQVTSFSLTFTKTGTFHYYCIVHGKDMAGTIDVVDQSVRIASPGHVRSVARKAIAGYLKHAPAAIRAATAAIAPPQHHADGTTTYHVNVGYASGQLGLMSFFPRKLRVHPGDTVIWDLVTVPHTITFLNGHPEPALIAPATWPGDGTDTVMFNPAILGPSANIGSPLDKTGMFNSGFLPAPGSTFSLKIGNVKGRIPYLCLLHDASGMRGTLVVVPA